MKRLLTIAAVVALSPVIVVGALFVWAVCEMEPVRPVEVDE